MVLAMMWIIPVSANERFIPLELFTGGKIRNDTEIKYTPADNIEFRNASLITIKTNKKIKFNLLFDKNRSLQKKIKIEQLRNDTK